MKKVIELIQDGKFTRKVHTRSLKQVLYVVDGKEYVVNYKESHNELEGLKEKESVKDNFPMIIRTEPSLKG